MDSPYLGTQQSANAIQPDRPYLGRISDMADEAERIGNYIEQFIDRCRGGASIVRSDTSTVPVSTGHLANLDRLTENLGRIDKLARELQTIG